VNVWIGHIKFFRAPEVRKAFLATSVRDKITDYSRRFTSGYLFTPLHGHQRKGKC